MASESMEEKCYCVVIPFATYKAAKSMLDKTTCIGKVILRKDTAYRGMKNIK